MKPNAKRHASFLLKAVLASTVFCGVSFPAWGFTNLDTAANGQTSANPAYPPTTGYDYIDDGVDFYIINGDNIGTTLGVSVDNITNKAGSILNFEGTSNVQGDIGFTNPISAINLLGVGDTVNFLGTTFNVGTLTLANNTASFVDSTIVDGNIDALFGSNSTLDFQGSGEITGNIGATFPITLMTVNSLGNASETFTLTGTNINIGTLHINDDNTGVPATGTTLVLDNPNMNFTGLISVNTNDEDTIDILNAKTITGNIGSALKILNLVKVGQNNDTNFTGHIFSTLTQFQGDNILTLGNNSTIHGPVDTTVPTTGNINFAGSGIITGAVGATNQLNVLSLSGANGIASFQSTVRANTLNFNTGANSSTKAVFNDVVTLNQIDNKTGTNGFGNVFFGSTGTVGAVGATNLLNVVSLTGANKTVQFNGIVNAKSLTFSSTANANTTAKFAQELIINSIDNTTTTDGNGIVILTDTGNIIGKVGATKQLNSIEIQGGSSTTEFTSTVNSANINFSVNADANTIATFDAAITLNSIDNKTGVDGNGQIIFLNTAMIQGPIGSSNSLNKIFIQGLGSTVDFQKTVNADNLIFAAPANANTTAQFEGDVILGNIGNTSAIGSGNLVFLGTGSSKVNGTVGATAAINNINLQSAGTSVEFVGAVKASNIIFSNNANSLTTVQFDAPLTLLGNIDNTTLTDGNGIVTFSGNTTLTGTVGQTKALGTLNLSGPGIIVDFQNTVNAQNLIFQPGATNTTTAEFNADAQLGVIDNLVGGPGNGIVTFLSSGIVSGPVGATNALNIINLQGPNKTVNFAQNIDAGSFLFSGTANAGTTASFGNNVIINSDIDNTTGTTGVGTLTFLGNGTINGTIAATDSLNAINLQGPLSIVNFNGDVIKTSPIFINTSATVNIADVVTLNASIDNISGTPYTGNLTFVGDGIVTGSIGATNPLNLITINSQLPNKTVELRGSTINAANIFLNDDFATPTTLTLNGVGLTSVAANILARTDNLDILNLVAPTSIIGNIGSITQKLNIIKFANVTSLTGDIFAYNTEFQNNTLLTIGNNSDLFTPITTLVPNTGILNFTGSTSIFEPIGSLGFSLNSVNINGPDTSQVALNNHVYATNTDINNGARLLVNGLRIINGNLTLNNGRLSLAEDAMPFTVTGAFTLDNETILELDLSSTLSNTAINSAIAKIDAGAKLLVDNVSYRIATSQTPFTIIASGPGSIINAIPVSDNSLLLNLSTQADNINNKLNLIVDITPPSTFAKQSNTTGIANAVDYLFQTPLLTGTLQEILDNLLRLSTVDQLESALAQLAPTVDGGILYESYNTNLASFDILSSKLNNNLYAKVKQLAILRGLLGMNHGDMPEPNRGTWIKAFGQYADQDERQGVEGYRNKMRGIALGGDLVITDDLLLGVSFSYADLDIKNHVANESRTDIDSYQATLYGQYLFECPFYVNAFASYGYNQYNLFRNVIFGSLYITPEADFHSWQYSAKAEAGYSLALNNYFITPFVNMYYSRLSTTEYTEIGVGNANQKVNSGDFNILQSGAGIKLATEFDYISSIVQPEIHAAAFYNIVNDRMELTSQFTGAGPNFATIGFKPARASYDLGASLTSSEPDLGIVVTISYDYQMKEDYNAHNGFFKVRYEW